MFNLIFVLGPLVLTQKYGESRPMGYVWSHENFNETSTVTTNAYSYSKVTAEKVETTA